MLRLMLQIGKKLFWNLNIFMIFFQILCLFETSWGFRGPITCFLYDRWQRGENSRRPGNKTYVFWKKFKKAEWVKKIFFWKVAWIWSHHLHLQWKLKLWAGKFAWGVKAKHCWALSTNFWIQKVCWHHPAIFCLIPSSKLSRQ